MNCPNCDKKTDILANFCPNCGTDLRTPAGAKQPRRAGDIFPADAVCEKACALILPAITLVIVMAFTGFSGAAAVTTALSAISPFGMTGGMIELGIIGIAADIAVSFLISKLLKGRLEKQWLRGANKDKLMKAVEEYPVSKSLRRELKDAIREFRK